MEGGEGEARVAVYELAEGKVVLKEWRPAHGRIIKWWSRWYLQREMAHYRLLAGTRGIPAFLAALDERSFVIEHIEGSPINRGLPKELLHAGLDSLEDLLGRLHARRFAHMDARNRANTLIDPQGNAWLIDLGQSVDCSRGVLRRAIFPVLRRIDRSAVLKFRARYAPETLDPAVRERLVRKQARRKTGWSPFLGRVLRGIFARGHKVRVRFRPRSGTRPRQASPAPPSPAGGKNAAGRSGP